MDSRCVKWTWLKETVILYCEIKPYVLQHFSLILPGYIIRSVIIFVLHWYYFIVSNSLNAPFIKLQCRPDEPGARFHRFLYRNQYLSFCTKNMLSEVLYSVECNINMSRSIFNEKKYSKLYFGLKWEMIVSDVQGSYAWGTKPACHIVLTCG